MKKLSFYSSYIIMETRSALDLALYWTEIQIAPLPIYVLGGAAGGVAPGWVPLGSVLSDPADLEATLCFGSLITCCNFCAGSAENIEKFRFQFIVELSIN